MPRYSLNRSPCTTITSPGASSVPASIEPSMTVSAPAAIAFATSPDDVMPPSAITGTPCAEAPRRLVDRRDLRHADPGDDARRADRARPLAGLDRIGARVDQRLGRLAGGDVAGDHLELARQTGDARDHVEDAARVSVGGVDDQHVGPRGEQRLRTLERVRADPDGRADTQPSVRRPWSRSGTRRASDVLDRDQAAQDARRRRRSAASRCGDGAAAARPRGGSYRSAP